ncbi:MAG: class I SAM-dependent methyltransferase [Patescibacteria group bacterium]
MNIPGRFEFGRATEQLEPVDPSQEASFCPDTIVHPGMPDGGRNLDEYEAYLLFDRADLEGERVLDLGCGPELKFARQLQEAGIVAHVVSLSPDFVSPQHGHKARTLHDGPALAAIGEQLPFRDNSFDYVFGLFSHAHSLDPLRLVREVARVLDYGGIGKLSPDSADICSEAPLASVIRQQGDMQQYFADQGVQFTAEGLPDGLFYHRAWVEGFKVEVGSQAMVLKKWFLAAPAPTDKACVDVVPQRC